MEYKFNSTNFDSSKSVDEARSPGYCFFTLEKFEKVLLETMLFVVYLRLFILHTAHNFVISHWSKVFDLGTEV